MINLKKWFGGGIIFVCTLFCAFPLHADNWVQMESGTTNTLNAIWGFSEDDVFAVGNGGTILHYDGTGWSSMASGTTFGLYGVWGSAPDDVFAVGWRTILHYDGTGWSPMANGATGELCTVWGSSGTDVFVGGLGTLLHYNGSEWAPVTPIPYYHAYITGLWGTGASNIYATGGRVGVWHYNGSSWQKVNVPIDDERYFFSIWGYSASDIHVMGYKNRAIHFDGVQWTDLKTGFDPQPEYTAIWGSAPDNVYAVSSMGVLFRYDGEAWLYDSFFPGIYLNGIWGTSANNMFIVGGNGTILNNNVDFDNDGVLNDTDNCPYDFNPVQGDDDNNGIGNICEEGPPCYVHVEISSDPYEVTEALDNNCNGIDDTLECAVGTVFNGSTCVECLTDYDCNDMYKCESTLCVPRCELSIKYKALSSAELKKKSKKLLLLITGGQLFDPTEDVDAGDLQVLKTESNAKKGKLELKLQIPKDTESQIIPIYVGGCMGEIEIY